MRFPQTSRARTAVWLLLVPATRAAYRAPPLRAPSAEAARPRAPCARMLLGRRPPPEIMRIAQPDWRFKESSCTESELVAIWSAFEKVYGSREKALAASRKNQQVILPYLNSPSTILGAHKSLVKIFGKEKAASIIEKNPGVLACDPASLASTPPAEIEKAARTVAWIDELDPNVKAGVPFLTWFTLVGIIGGRIVSCSGGACGSAAGWDLQVTRLGLT
mmetsp:Transcript_22644/g.52171  ORF Transcript_22644/g.52171 Transcript_22644/m.52171 type:complete len:219 (-) Transcript_22644:224-880(-)